MCGKRLKAWKTIPIPRRTRLTSTPARRDLLAARATIRPRVDRLEQVDAAQERRLARAGRADQADDLVLGEREVDPAQHLELAERLVQALELRARALGSRCDSRRLPPPPVARDEPVGEARERDRDQRRRAIAATRYGVQLNVAASSICVCRSASTTPSTLDERGVLLEPDEVVEQRRDHPPHGLREDDEAQRLAGASARASARPRPGSGAPTRCRRGRPRTRTPCRRGRARRSPRRAGESGTPSSCERGHAEPEHEDDEDRRDAAEEVRRRRSRARGSGRTPGPGGSAGPRARARVTRMIASAMQKIFTLIEERRRDLRERLRGTARQSKKYCLEPRPSRASASTRTATTAEEDDRADDRDRRPRAPAGRGVAHAQDPRAAVAFQLPLLEDGRAADLGEPALLQRLDRAVRPAVG